MIDHFWLDHRDQGFGGRFDQRRRPDRQDRRLHEEQGLWRRGGADPRLARCCIRQRRNGSDLLIVDRDGRIRDKIAGAVHYPRLEKRIVPLLQSRAAEEPR